MLDASFVKALASLGVEATAKIQSPISGDDPRRRLLVKPDGSYEVVSLAPEPQRATAGSIASLVEKAADWYARTTDADTVGPEVWYSHKSGIVAIRGRDDRRETVLFPLTYSDPFRDLIEASSHDGKDYSHSEFVHSLKTTFKGTVGELLLKAVTRINWKFGQTGTAEMTTGRTSIDKSLLSEMSGVEKIPEYVIFKVPVFGELDFVASVEALIIPDASTQAFTLFTRRDDIEATYRVADEFLAQQIGIYAAAAFAKDTDLPVYNGKP